MPSGLRAFFRPLRLQALACALGPHASRPSCLQALVPSSGTVLKCVMVSSLPHMLFKYLFSLLVLCILLSDRFRHLPSWALPPHSVIMSLSDSAWSSLPFRSSPTIAAQPTHPIPSACSSQSPRLTPALQSIFLTLSSWLQMQARPGHLRSQIIILSTRPSPLTPAPQPAHLSLPGSPQLWYLFL